MIRSTFVFQRFKCKDHEFGRVVNINDRYESIKCEKCENEAVSCGGPQDEKCTPTFTQRVFAHGEFWDRSLNRIFTSQKQREQYMAANGLINKQIRSSTHKDDRTVLAMRDTKHPFAKYAKRGFEE